MEIHYNPIFVTIHILPKQLLSKILAYALLCLPILFSLITQTLKIYVTVNIS